MSTLKFELTPANIIAKVISGVVHPMVIPILGSLVIFNMHTTFAFANEEIIKMYMLGSIFICTFILPVILIVILKLMGSIKSVSLNDQNDRLLPFLSVAVCYSICFWFIYRMQIQASLFPYNLALPLMLGATLSVLIALVVNNWFKISIHMMGIGGLTGSFIAISLKYSIPLDGLIYTFIFLSGITGFARLQLNAHTPAQVYSGFLTGMFCNSALIFLNIPYAFIQ